MKKIIVLLTFVLILITTGCTKKNNTYEFNYWNDCTSLTTLKNYVNEVTADPKSDSYIPKEDRIAVFDMDGTLCGELFPEYLEYLMLEYRILEDPSFKDIATDDLIEVANQIRESGKTYSTPAISGYDLIHANAAAKAYAGMTLEEFYEFCEDFLDKDCPCFTNFKYKDSIYKPMIEVVDFLQKNDFKTYVVSGSDRFLCRVVACKALNIPYDQVIGMDVRLEATNQGETDGLNYQFAKNDKLVRTDELLIKNLKMNKVVQIAKEIGKQPVLSFGNSSGDVAMHNYTITNNKYKSGAYMLIADDDVRDYPHLEETAKRKASWEEYGYNIISMKNDFKTIYGYDVAKASA